MRASGNAVRGVAIVAFSAALGLAIGAGCGPAPAATGPKAGASAAGSATTSGTAKAFDQCDSSPPLTTKYLGLLQDARCDYDRYPIMADVAKSLGVECRYCHLPDPSNPKEEMYGMPTPKKEIANWMRMHLMTAIKPADGSAMSCKSCHVDAKGKPVAKILGEPRDTTHAHEWMSLVMTTKFVVAKTGEKLKCKHCHVGNIGTAEWQPKVILTDHIPAH